VKKVAENRARSIPAISLLPLVEHFRSRNKPLGSIFGPLSPAKKRELSLFVPFLRNA
jgi:hypothetical protein